MLDLDKINSIVWFDVVALCETCHPSLGFVCNNVHFQYGWRIQDKEKKKAFMCMAQTIEERKEWVDAILQEREKVRGENS